MRRAEQGFGLLEVLIAAVILISLLAAVLPLFDSGLFQLKKAEKVEQQLSVQKRVFTKLSTINPGEVSSGEGEDSDFTFHWDATRITPLYDQRDPEHSTDRKVALYQVEVSLYRNENSKPVTAFKFDIVGWQE